MEKNEEKIKQIQTEDILIKTFILTFNENTQTENI